MKQHTPTYAELAIPLFRGFDIEGVRGAFHRYAAYMVSKEMFEKLMKAAREATGFEFVDPILECFTYRHLFYKNIPVLPSDALVGRQVIAVEKDLLNALTQRMERNEPTQIRRCPVEPDTGFPNTAEASTSNEPLDTKSDIGSTGIEDKRTEADNAI